MKKFTVYHSNKNLDEIEVIKSLLKWQNMGVDFIVDPDKALRLSEGRCWLAVVTDNDQVLFGAKGLIQYIEDNGLWLM